jgi:DNA-binding transcriptional LysR family regulator
MEVFVNVVERGGLSAAARELRMTPSAISKLVGRLEARLGTRLVNRTTRKLQLTPEGQIFYDRATTILADIEAAERSASDAEKPVGRIRINTSASYGTHVLAPIAADFLDRYPGISIDIIQTDKVVDLLAERADIAIRAGPMANSSLLARKLGDTPLPIVASPAYLARCGEPKTTADLEKHNRLGFCYVRASEGWPFCVAGERLTVPVKGRILASDGEALRTMALNGVGLARVAGFSVRHDIAAGRLVEVLADIAAPEMETFHAVYVGQGGPLPARVRALLDYLAEHGRVQ